MNQLSQLLPYLNGELTTQELKEVEMLLNNNPVYFEILGGLALMKKELGSVNAVKIHLKEKKEALRKKLLTDTIQLHIG